MKKALIFGVLFFAVIALSVGYEGKVAYADANKKQVNFLDPDKMSVVVCGVSNQKWSFIKENYNNVRARGMMQMSTVGVVLGIHTNAPRIKDIDVLDAETKIILTSDKGDVIEGLEGTLFREKGSTSGSSMIQASVYGAFPDTVKSITVEGYIKAKYSDGSRQQTIVLPIEKGTVKLFKGGTNIKKAKVKEKPTKLKM